MQHYGTHPCSEDLRKKIGEAVESLGCDLLYLPPCPPELNTFDEAFTRLKAMLR